MDRGARSRRDCGAPSTHPDPLPDPLRPPGRLAHVLPCGGPRLDAQTRVPDVRPTPGRATVAEGTWVSSASTSGPSATATHTSSTPSTVGNSQDPRRERRSGRRPHSRPRSLSLHPFRPQTNLNPSRGKEDAPGVRHSDTFNFGSRVTGGVRGPTKPRTRSGVCKPLEVATTARVPKCGPGDVLPRFVPGGHPLSEGVSYPLPPPDKRK